MTKTKRFTAALLCLFFCSGVLAGCYDNREIEDLAYVIAIGIDEAEGNSFDLTFQTAVPQAITGGGGEGTDITSYRTDNFLSGLKKAGQYLSRTINLSHTKIIVVSEAIAQKGITAFVNGLQQGLQIRQDINIIVAAQGAKKYLESIQPKLSSNPSRYYELLFKSYESDFLVPQAQLEDYLYRAKNQGAQPLAIYTTVDKNIVETKKPEGGGDDGKKEEGGEKKSGGGSGKEGGGQEQQRMSLDGLAVFKFDKMVGRLNAREASVFALMTGKNNINFDIVDPLDSRFKVLSILKKEKTSSTNITFKDGKPLISIDLIMDINVQSVQSDYDYDEPGNAGVLNRAYKELLEKEVRNLLQKVTCQFKSDIFGYGELAKRNFVTIDKWEKARWPEVFPEARYNLKLSTEVIRHGQ
ncbi:Ger(x)C family spore germination protein [Ruminiclostridium cellobioparum]|uniref:Ger(x)C family spore germination protein n=1 Tax=Ruminiclostridium cellobioparum TaxID=29355 RepID=UPI0004813A42|nr:Ger(x)C family spore germination protein [Ruminiclostridium cellobioparum]